MRRPKAAMPPGATRGHIKMTFKIGAVTLMRSGFFFTELPASVLVPAAHGAL